MVVCQANGTIGHDIRGKLETIVYKLFKYTLLKQCELQTASFKNQMWPAHRE